MDAKTFVSDTQRKGCANRFCADRSRTIRAMIDKKTRAMDLDRSRFSILRRWCYVERAYRSAIDFARLAGFEDAGVIIRS